jgi:hypothetical protein
LQDTYLKISNEQLSIDYEFKDIMDNRYTVKSIDDKVVSLNFKPCLAFKDLTLFTKDEYENALKLNFTTLNIVSWNENIDEDISNIYLYLLLLVRYNSENRNYILHDDNIPLGFKLIPNKGGGDCLFYAFTNYISNNELKIDLLPNSVELNKDTNINVYLRILCSLFAITYNTAHTIIDISELSGIVSRLSFSEELIKDWYKVANEVLREEGLAEDLNKEQLIEHLKDLSSKTKEEYLEIIKKISFAIALKTDKVNYTQSMISGGTNYYSDTSEIKLLSNIYNVNIWLFQKNKELDIFKPESYSFFDNYLDNKLCEDSIGNSGVKCGELGQCFTVEELGMNFDKSKIHEYPRDVLNMANEQRLNYKLSFTNIEGSLKQTVFLIYGGNLDPSKEELISIGHFESLNYQHGFENVPLSKLISKIKTQIDENQEEKLKNIRHSIIAELGKENKKINEDELEKYLLDFLKTQTVNSKALSRTTSYRSLLAKGREDYHS